MSLVAVAVGAAAAAAATVTTDENRATRMIRRAIHGSLLAQTESEWRERG